MKTVMTTLVSLAKQVVFFVCVYVASNQTFDLIPHSDLQLLSHSFRD